MQTGGERDYFPRVSWTKQQLLPDVVKGEKLEISDWTAAPDDKDSVDSEEDGEADDDDSDQSE